VAGACGGAGQEKVAAARSLAPEKARDAEDDRRDPLGAPTRAAQQRTADGARRAEKAAQRWQRRRPAETPGAHRHAGGGSRAARRAPRLARLVVVVMKERRLGGCAAVPTRLCRGGGAHGQGFARRAAQFWEAAPGNDDDQPRSTTASCVVASAAHCRSGQEHSGAAGRVPESSEVTGRIRVSPLPRAPKCERRRENRDEMPCAPSPRFG
jgi:hypothetical protein